MAIIVGITVALYLNSDYLQAKMLGNWKVVDSSINYDLDKEPKTVRASSHEIKIDGQEGIPIRYSSKSRSSSFSRKNQEGKIYYYFEGIDDTDDYYDYLLVFDKSTPDEMVLVTFEPSTEDGLANTFVLERNDSDGE